jgi:hypothetical protein
MVFKVPMLRNVTLTAPYFHDDKVPTLPEAVRLMAWMQLDVKLNPEEISEILHFLKTLEGEHPIIVSDTANELLHGEETGTSGRNGRICGGIGNIGHAGTNDWTACFDQ